MSDEKQLCACGCGAAATGKFRGWSHSVPDGTPYNMACLGGSSGVGDFAKRMRSTTAAKVELEPRCELCGGRAGLFTWGQMDDSGIAGAKLCTVCCPDDPGDGAVNVANVNKVRRARGMLPWQCGTCEKPATRMPGWTQLCGECPDMRVKESPAPPAKTEPEALRGLAEAMRSIATPVPCEKCHALVPGHRVASVYNHARSGTRTYGCPYCEQNDRIRLGIVHQADGKTKCRIEYGNGRGVGRMRAPVPPPDPERAPWDWDADDVGYLP